MSGSRARVELRRDRAEPGHHARRHHAGRRTPGSCRTTPTSGDSARLVGVRPPRLRAVVLRAVDLDDERRGRPAGRPRGRGGGRGSAPARRPRAARLDGSAGRRRPRPTTPRRRPRPRAASRTTARCRTRPASGSSASDLLGRASRCWTTASTSPAAARGQRSHAAASTVARARRCVHGRVLGEIGRSRASATGDVDRPRRRAGRVGCPARRAGCASSAAGSRRGRADSSAERPAIHPTGACRAAARAAARASRRPLSADTTSGATSRHRPAAIWSATWSLGDPSARELSRRASPPAARAARRAPGPRGSRRRPLQTWRSARRRSRGPRVERRHAARGRRAGPVAGAETCRDVPTTAPVACRHISRLVARCAVRTAYAGVVDTCLGSTGGGAVSGRLACGGRVSGRCGCGRAGVTWVAGGRHRRDRAVPARETPGLGSATFPPRRRPVLDLGTPSSARPGDTLDEVRTPAVDLYEYQAKDAVREARRADAERRGRAHAGERAKAAAEQHRRPRRRQGAGEDRRPRQGRRRQASAGRRRRPTTAPTTSSAWTSRATSSTRC